MYCMDTRRFATKINGKIYDINGEVVNSNAWVLWDEFEEEPARSEIIRTKMFLML